MVRTFTFLCMGSIDKWFYINPSKIEGKAMIRNRYNYPIPPIRDIKGKETQT